MTSVKSVLRSLAPQLDLDANELIAYAEEDDIGGWDFGKGDWEIGSIFGDEGQILYALIRALRPETVVEVGVAYGCSSKHILTALTKNRKGKLISVDPEPMADESRFTEAQLKRWEIIEESIFKATLPKSADVVFEDGTHKLDFTIPALKRLMKLSPRILLSHDLEHYIVGEDMRKAWDDVIGDYQTALTSGSDSGLGWYVNPEA